MYRPPLRQQSEEIRQRMLHVRSRLPWSMDRARAESRRLTSWKFYVRRYPWIAAGVLAGVAYWLVPKSRRRVVVQSSQRPPSRHRDSDLGSRFWRAFRGRGKDDHSDTSEVVAKSSIVGVLTSFLVSSAMRMATAYAGNQFQRFVAQRMGVPPTASPMGAPMGSPMPHGSHHRPSQPEQTHDR